jgi:hypothetical protein
MEALRYRIAEKCSKTYPENDFDEEVLLIVAALPQMGRHRCNDGFRGFVADRQNGRRALADA